MKLGILLPQHDVSGETLLDAALLAEEAGLDSVWVVDHLHGLPDPQRPVLEGWTALSAVMGATSRITTGTLVLRVGLRLPALVASMAATAMKVSGGRFIAGLGIGDAVSIPEQEAYGIGWKDKPQRLAELDETIDLLRGASPPVRVWVGGTAPELLSRGAAVEAVNLWVKVEKMEALIEAFRTHPGEGEVTWGGNWPRPEGLQALEEMGVAHVVVATGAANYRERIEGLVSFRDAGRS